MNSMWTQYRELSSLWGSCESVSSGAQQDAACRTRISRVYYAAYHKVKKIATSGSPDGRCEHEKLIKHCKAKSQSREVQLLGAELERLRNMRVQADYRLGLDQDMKNLLGASKNAEAHCDEIFKQVENIINKNVSVEKMAIY